MIILCFISSKARMVHTQLLMETRYSFFRLGIVVSSIANFLKGPMISASIAAAI